MTIYHSTYHYSHYFARISKFFSVIITHLIIPKQTGSTDSCEISHDEEIIDILETHRLITLGWIHTHPTQTAFLSSVDFHTHVSYQRTLPEAVAIVCSPSFNEVKYLNITPNGLHQIQRCQKRGFHPHPDSLRQEAEHCKEDPTLRITVHDLR